VTPLSRSVESVGEEIIELLSHADNTGSHALDLTFPFLVQTLVGKDGAGNAGTVEGRVRVHGADDDLQLTLDTSPFLGVGADEGEGSDTFSVETHVLGEGLSKGDLVALLNEVADSERVAGGVSRGKALVCHVEEGEKLLLFDEVGNFFPLGLGGIDTGWVVGASMEEDDGALGSVLYCG
jgi:hypothetical protein